VINVFKRWESRIGGLNVTQSVHFHNDGKELQVITGMSTPGGDYQNASSLIPFEAHEKLADDGFRMEIARRDLTGRVKSLRAMVDFAEKALTQQFEQAIDEAVRRDERNGRHTP